MIIRLKNFNYLLPMGLISTISNFDNEIAPSFVVYRILFLVDKNPINFLHGQFFKILKREKIIVYFNTHFFLSGANYFNKKTIYISNLCLKFTPSIHTHTHTHTQIGLKGDNLDQL